MLHSVVSSKGQKTFFHSVAFTAIVLVDHRHKVSNLKYTFTFGSDEKLWLYSRNVQNTVAFADAVKSIIAKLSDGATSKLVNEREELKISHQNEAYCSPDLEKHRIYFQLYVTTGSTLPHFIFESFSTRTNSAMVT